MSRTCRPRTPLGLEARSLAFKAHTLPTCARSPAHSPALVPPKYLQRHKLSPELLLRSLLTQLFPSIVEKLGTEVMRTWLKGLGDADVT